MRFETQSTYHPKPFEPSQYICAHVVSVVCSVHAGDDVEDEDEDEDEDDDEGDDYEYEEVVAARLAVDYLDIFRIEAEGQSVLHVCDSDSSGWEHVYSATIEPAANFAEIRKDFGFDDDITGLVFIHQAVFHRSLRHAQQRIIDSICKMFPQSTATVMWKGTTDLSDKELASLGFRIVAGHDLLFRPNMLICDYDTAKEDESYDWTVPIEAQQYVEEHWDWPED